MHFPVLPPYLGATHLSSPPASLGFALWAPPGQGIQTRVPSWPRLPLLSPRATPSQECPPCRVAGVLMVEEPKGMWDNSSREGPW